MKVLWTVAAQADLAELSDYIKADNPARAVSFVHEIIASGEGLADLPRAFPLVPRYEHRGIRRRGHGRYLIFYRINGEQIEVLHVLHGAQDYERLLFPGE